MTQIYKTKEFLAQFAFVGNDVQIFEQALILKPEVIQLGDGVRIDDFTRIEGGSGLRIGKYVHIASFAEERRRLGIFRALDKGPNS